LKKFYLFAVAAIIAASVLPAYAAPQHNLYGYAWSETIGWINFNGSNYGVASDSDGNLWGYAWAEHIGWVTFNQADLTGCPSGTCSARFNRTTGEVSGWARAYRAILPQGETLGGWDGWIHLRGSGYGVNANGCNWGGYTWGSDVVGWIHFRGSNYGVTGTGDACTLVPTPPPPIPLPSDYILSANPTIISVNVRGTNPITSTETTIKASSLNNFSGDVGLKVVAVTPVLPGAVFKFIDSPAPNANIFIPENGEATSQFSVIVPPNAQPGAYNITIQGTRGSEPQTNVILNVSVRDSIFREVFRPVQDLLGLLFAR